MMLKSKLPVVAKNVTGPCEQGQTATATGCIPAEGPANKVPAAGSASDARRLKKVANYLKKIGTDLTEEGLNAEYLAEDVALDLNMDEAEAEKLVRQLVADANKKPANKLPKEPKPAVTADQPKGDAPTMSVNEDMFTYDNKKAERVFGKGRVTAEHVAGLLGVLGDPGVKLEITTPAHGGVWVRALGQNYKAIRKFDIMDGQLQCENAEIEIDEAAQGQGIGLKILSRQIPQLQKAGVERINIVAAGSKEHGKYVGYKVWPKFGYDGYLEDGHKQALLQGTRDRRFLEADTIQELYAMPGGKEAWEEHGSSIRLSLNLKPDSPSMKTFNDYLAKKREAKKGWVSKQAVPEQRGDKMGGVEEPDLSPADERAIDEVWQEILSQGKGSGRPTKVLKSNLPAVAKGTCEPGQRSDLTGCTPAEGPENKLPDATKPVFKVKPPKKLYRGVMESGKGAGTFSLGRGLYSTPSRGFLRGFKYDKIIELTPEQAFPRNPLVLRNPSMFSDWLLQESGMRRMSEFNAKYPDPGEFVQSRGYDGVWAGDEVVRYMPKEEKGLGRAVQKSSVDDRLPAFQEAINSLTDAEKVGLSVWYHPGPPPIVILDEMDWHDGLGGRKLAKPASSFVGDESRVIWQNEGGKPDASAGWVRLLQAKNMTRVVAKVASARVLAAIEELGGARGGLVDLQRLGQHLGAIPGRLHQTLDMLRRQGKVTMSGAEGRHGLDPGAARWLLPDPGGHDLGYVSLKGCKKSLGPANHLPRG